MKNGSGLLEEIETEGYHIKMIMPLKTGSYPVFYLHCAVDETQKIWEKLKNKEVILAFITGEAGCWNHDMTPWEAPGLGKNSGEFAGGGRQYVRLLTEKLIKVIENQLNKEKYKLTFRGLTGYSLGGLFAVYAMTKTDVFSCVASVSGSLWYDGFMEYMKQQKIRQADTWYFSLGNKEAGTKNKRMAQVWENTLKITQIIKNQQGRAFFEENEGGHFQDVPGRMAKALDYLSNNT